ncbi:MAG: anthranilate phosphoribosyltransferase [Candidatus Hydrothermarchaeaceae archaeon]
MKEFINKVVDGEDLTEDEAEGAMKTIMSGGATQAQIGAFLAALRMKGENVAEITAFARVMREFASSIHPKVKGTLVDTCGTGGDKMKTFNISTLAAFVVAGADVPIAKHGNRSVTSKSGSADVLEALGMKLDMTPADVEKSIEEIGIGFMFAPAFHKAMKHAIGPRKEIGIRTVFNILGPLTNPADAKAQVMGVYDSELTEKMANVLKNLGIERCMVVHGLEGMDEMSTVSKTQVSELRDNEVISYVLKPEDLGLKRASTTDLVGWDAAYNAGIAMEVMRDKAKGPKRDVVVLNAAAGIYVGGMADNMEEAIEIANASIDSGKAFEKLETLIKRSGGRLGSLGA